MDLVLFQVFWKDRKREILGAFKLNSYNIGEQKLAFTRLTALVETQVKKFIKRHSEDKDRTQKFNNLVTDLLARVPNVIKV